MSKVISIRVSEEFYDEFKKYSEDHTLSPLEKGWVLKISLVRGFHKFINSPESSILEAKLYD